MANMLSTKTSQAKEWDPNNLRLNILSAMNKISKVSSLDGVDCRLTACNQLLDFDNAVPVSQC